MGAGYAGGEGIFRREWRGGVTGTRGPRLSYRA